MAGEASHTWEGGTRDEFGAYTKTKKRSSNDVHFNFDQFIHVNGGIYSLTHCTIGEFGAYTVIFLKIFKRCLFLGKMQIMQSLPSC